MADGILKGQDFDKVDIFLSYNHEDDREDGRASALHERLKAAGYEVAFDKGLRGGEDFERWIDVNVARCQLVVALWSKRSLGTRWCQHEAKQAHANEKLFPIVLEEIGDADVPPFMLGVASRSVRVPYDTPDLMERIGARVTASRAEAERKRQSSERAIRASKKTHLPDVLATGQPDLFGRDGEESMLLGAWESCAPGADPARKTNLVVLHAIGGAGKTALLRRLVDDLAATDFVNAEHVIGWSAYSQGSHENSNVDAGAFITAALDIMGYEGVPPPDDVARARLLAALMQRQRTLLLLDGIEPLQSPPHVNGGRLKDKGLATLLIELARENPGLVVVTSRQPLPETAKIARVHNHSLAKLAPQAGAALLKRLGCWGAATDLEAASDEADGHALLITALGGYIEAVKDGDIRKRDNFRLGEITFTAEEMAVPDETVRAAKKAAAVMDGYIAAFVALDAKSKGEGVAERVLLNIVGLFDRPADGSAVNALLNGDAIPGLTDEMAGWPPHQKTGLIAAAKKRLRTLKLLNDADPGDKDALDAHPIVRAHFAKVLKSEAPGAFRAAHERLYRLYTASCVKELPDTLEEMTPLFHAIGHGCAAGLQQETWTHVYWKRVRRGNQSFIDNLLGAYGADLGALAHLFDAPWGTVSSNLISKDQGVALACAAYALQALGRLAESEEAQSAAGALAVASENWKNAAIAAHNLSAMRLGLGKVVSADGAGAEGVAYADRSGDAFHMMAARTTHADALMQAGKLTQAAAFFADAEARQQKDRLHQPHLYSVQGYQYCDLLLGCGRAAEVRGRADWIANFYGRIGGQVTLLDHGLNQLADGRALALLIAHGQADRAQARARLDQAVAALRRAGTEHRLPSALLTRAAHLRRSSEFSAAAKDLEESLDIADRGGMKLYLTDCALEAARLELEQIPGAPPETLVPLVETVEVVEEPAKLSFIDRMLGKKPTEPQRHLVERIVSPPPAPWTPRGPLNEAERKHLADAEAQYKVAFELVQETGYHRRDGELVDLRARLDALA